MDKSSMQHRENELKENTREKRHKREVLTYMLRHVQKKSREIIDRGKWKR